MEYIEKIPPGVDNKDDKLGDSEPKRASVTVSPVEPPPEATSTGTTEVNPVWLDLTRAIAGCAFDHQADSAAVLEQLISKALTSQVLKQYLTYLHRFFHPGEDDRVRVVRLLITIVEILRQDTDVSISFIDSELLDPDNPVFDDGSNGDEEDDNDSIHRSCRETLIFMAIGWITNLFIPRLISGQPFAVDTEHATGYQTSHVAANLASRPILETIRELGDILPTRRRTEEENDDESSPMIHVSGADYHMLRIASMNISTLQIVGRVKIEWTSSFASHLDFDPAHLDEVTGTVTPILKLFRYPSLCYLFAPQQSLLNQLLENWYQDDKKPVRFTTKALMQEILLSYQLLVRFDRKARASYLGQLRADLLKGCFDRELDTLCVWRQNSLFLERFQRAPFQIRETFYSSSDFPIFSARLVDIDRFINSIQPNRISSLWEDRRDMLRWYTFWAVIILGVLSLVIALVQTGIGAAQVELAIEGLKSSD